MMPDLGKYADTVLSAYAASIVLLLAIVVLSVIRGRRVRRDMASMLDRQNTDG